MHAILVATNKSFSMMKAKDMNRRSSRHLLMASICKLRIQIARFLALYRWHISNQTYTLSSNSLSKRDANFRLVSSTFDTFRHAFDHKLPQSDLISNLRPIEPIDFNKPQNISSRWRSILYLLDDKVTSVTSAIFRNRILYIEFGKEGTVQIELHENGTKRLKEFAVAWPRIKTTPITRNIVAYFAKAIKNTENPVVEAQQIIHQLYLRGQFNFIYWAIRPLHKHFSFVFHHCKTHIKLVYPEQFAPANMFEIKLKPNGIILYSESPMYIEGDNEKHFITYNLTADSNLTQIINEVTQIAFHTRLMNIWNLIQLGLATISLHKFNGTFKDEIITIKLFSQIVCQIELNPKNGNPIVRTFGGIGISGHEFIKAIEGCGCQRNEVINIVFIHSLAKMILGEALGHRSFIINESLTLIRNFQHVIKFSYAMSFPILFGVNGGRPMISILSPTGNKFQTTEIIGLNQSYNDEIEMRLIDAIQSIKSAVVILQLQEALKTHDIKATRENNRIHFVYEPFECIDFSISMHDTWALDFIKPQAVRYQDPSYKIIGNHLSIRFVNWILAIVNRVANYRGMKQQTMGIYAMNTVINNLDDNVPSSFSFLIIHRFCGSLRVSLQPLNYMYCKSLGEQVYLARSISTPHIEIEFSRHFPINTHILNMAQQHSVNYAFGSFLNSSLIPLQYFYNLFFGKVNDEWDSTTLRDDGSFFLVYKKKYTLNMMLRPSQLFQMIIPSKGRSQILQIPLQSLPRSCLLSKLSHITYRLPLNLLDEVKTTIERFFAHRDILYALGFEPLRTLTRLTENSRVVFPYPKCVSYARISGVIKPDELAFEVEGDSELARNIKTFLNVQVDNKTKQQIVSFVLNLLLFDQRFVSQVMHFISHVITVYPIIDWTRTMEGTAIMINEDKILFSLALRNGFCLVELTQQNNDIGPDIMVYDKLGIATHYKLIKELNKYVDTIIQEVE